jgi:hypothetical protein
MKIVRISTAITAEDWGPDVLGYMVAVRCEACDRKAIQIIPMPAVDADPEKAIAVGLHVC